MPSVRVLDDPAAVAATAAEAVASAARVPGSVGILISGTVPAECYRAIDGRMTADDLAGLDVWYADERVVAPDHPESSYGRVMCAWPGLAAAAVHRVPAELGAIEASRRTARALRERGGEDPHLALALLAVGENGEIAALVRGDSALGARAFYFPARGGVWVSATMTLIDRVRHVVIVAVGPARAAIAARVLREPPSPDVPASLVRAETVTWLLDRAAAKRLG